MKNLLRGLCLSLLLASLPAHAADPGEFDVHAWDLKADYWPAVADSPVALYGLLGKQDGRYRFIRFATRPVPGEPWVHLPSRRPTWYTGYSHCVYAPFRARSCPRYGKAHFMSRDVHYYTTIVGGLITAGLLPTFAGVPAEFRFKEKKFSRALRRAYDDAGLGDDTLARLRADWDALYARELEGEGLVEKAAYEVTVGGTGQGALAGVSARWLTAPTLAYPWREIAETTVAAFATRLAEAAAAQRGKPLRELATLGIACPHARAREFVAEADCSGVLPDWKGEGLHLGGAMAVRQWRLALPRTLAFDSDAIRIDYDNGALMVRNKGLKQLRLNALELEAFGRRFRHPLQPAPIYQGASKGYLGFVSGGAIRALEAAAPVLGPDELDRQFTVRAWASYGMDFMRTAEIFADTEDFDAATALRQQIDAVQGGQRRQSIGEREAVAAAAPVKR